MDSDTSTTLAELATCDRELEADANAASFALMEHRWEAVNVHGFSRREYAKAIGRSRKVVDYYVTAYELATDPANALAAQDCLELAKVAEAKRQQVIDKAAREQTGIRQAARAPQPKTAAQLLAQAQTLLEQAAPLLDEQLDDPTCLALDRLDQTVERLRRWDIDSEFTALLDDELPEAPDSQEGR